MVNSKIAKTIVIAGIAALGAGFLGQPHEDRYSREDIGVLDIRVNETQWYGNTVHTDVTCKTRGRTFQDNLYFTNPSDITKGNIDLPENCIDSVIGKYHRPSPPQEFKLVKPYEANNPSYQGTENNPIPLIEKIKQIK